MNTLVFRFAHYTFAIIFWHDLNFFVLKQTFYNNQEAFSSFNITSRSILYENTYVVLRKFEYK